MVFSLLPVSLSSLKAEARVLRDEATTGGEALTQAQALERVAREHGYRDWNTARAAVPNRLHCPVQIGQRVSGLYLKQAFAGTVIGATLIGDSEFYRLTLLFDDPVDVVTFNSFSAFRQRVTARIDVYGVSPDRTSDGEPHLRLALERRP